MELNILFIANGVSSENGIPNISGGDVMWIEVAKRWKDEGHIIYVYTPRAGITLCKNLGLEANYIISNVPDGHSVLNYLLRFFRALSIPQQLTQYNGLVYSAAEHIYDVYPAMLLKTKNKGMIWVAVAHWVAPIKRKGASPLNSILFYLNQRLGFHYIRNKADAIFAVSDSTVVSLKKINIVDNVFPIKAGVEYDKIRSISAEIKEKPFDAIFMKRFDGAKGVFDIIEIWRQVVDAKKDAKLCMIGYGNNNMMKRLQKMVAESNLSNNITFTGPIYNYDEKYTYLAKSKLFLLPSYEENWAIVIGESLASGVPVICYELPEIKPIWKDGVIWVEKGDKSGFAQAVIRMLGDPIDRNILSEKGINDVKELDWGILANEQMMIIKAIEKDGTT